MTTTYYCPQIQIQSDALQVLIDNRDKEIPVKTRETVWFRVNDKSFNLLPDQFTLTDKDNGILVKQKSGNPTVYEYTNNNDNSSHCDLIFPYKHSILQFAKQPNLTCICSLNNMIIIGTGDGEIIKFEYPISINIKKYILKKEAHWADITKIATFASKVVILTVGLDMQIKIWSNDMVDSEFKEPARILKNEHKGRITDCVIIGTGRNIVSCGLDGQIVFWELGSGSAVWKGRRIRDLHDGYTCLDIVKVENDESNDNASDKFFECNGKLLWCGHVSGYISIWDCSTRLSLGEFKTNEDNTSVEKIKCINEHYIVVALNNGDLILYDFNFVTKKASMKWHSNVERIEVQETSVSIKDIQIYKDSIIVLSDNYLVRLNLDTGKLVDTFVGYDETLNGVSIYEDELIVVGKRGFISSFKLNESL